MNQEASPAPSPILDRIARHGVWVVFAVGLLIRIWGMGWGLPNDHQTWSYHPDEPVIYAYSQQIEPAKFDFAPGFYNYGTLYLTVLRVASDVAKTYSGAGDKEWAQMRSGHLAGRWVSALAGAGTAAVAFLMLRRRVSLAGAWFGAGLLVFAPAFVVHSRFQTVDVFATFLLILSAHYALKLLPDRDGNLLEGKAVLQTVILSAAFAGLSAGTKYTGVLTLATLAAAVLLAHRKSWFKLALVTAGVSIVAFLLATPGCLVETSRFLADVKHEVKHTGSGHGTVFLGLPNGFIWHLYNLLIGVGPLLLALGLLGLGTACWKRDPAALALAAFFLLYYILIGRAEVLFIRYTFPLMVGLAFGVGWLIDRTWGKPGWARVLPALAMLGLGGVLGGGLASTGTASIWMAGKDPRDEVVDYLRKPDIAATEVGMATDAWYYTPPYYPEVGAPRFAPIQKRLEWMRAAKGPAVVQLVVTGQEDQRYDWNVGLLDLQPQFIVVSSFEVEGLDRVRNQGIGDDLAKLLVSRYVAFGERLKQEYELVATRGGTGWGIHDMEYIRPFYWVWKRKRS